VRIRPLTTHDLAAALALNQAAQPAVGGLDRQALAHLEAEATWSLALDDDGCLIGFTIVFAPGADYASVNYRWFCDRYPSLAYLDRVVIHPAYRSRGLGSALYADLEQRIGGAHPLLTCEVNLRPRNDGSLRFHERLGFEAVGEQDTDGGSKRVVLLAKRLPGAEEGAAPT